MKTFVIMLKKNKKEIGCLAYADLEDSSINIDTIGSYLDNYNKNLIGVDCPDVVFAHRFFAKENLECTEHEHHAQILDDSYELVRDYNTYNWPKKNEAMEYIALSEFDISCVWNRGDSKAEIDLDEKTIKLFGVFSTYNRDFFEKNAKISYDFLPMLDYDPECFYINQLEDISLFCFHNEAFTSDSSSIVYVSKRMLG